MKISVSKDLAPLRLKAAAAIDAAAAAERAQHVSVGKDGVYLSKVAEATRYLAAGEPDDLTDFPYLRAEVGVTASNASELAELWLALNERLVLTIAPMIERVTSTAKKAVALASTPAAIDQVVADLTF